MVSCINLRCESTRGHSVFGGNWVTLAVLHCILEITHILSESIMYYVLDVYISSKNQKQLIPNMLRFIHFRLFDGFRGNRTLHCADDDRGSVGNSL